MRGSTQHTVPLPGDSKAAAMTAAPVEAATSSLSAVVVVVDEVLGVLIEMES